MTINLLQTPEYKALIAEHIEKTIEFMFSKDQEFAIACEIKFLTFNPELPSEIKDTFSDTVVFIISGYAFETAKLEDGVFYFEAGFGDTNFGSEISVPILAIKHLYLGDHPIVLNLAQHEEKTKTSTKNSMEALLNNPENKKLLKKKKL
ncbi:hypothetical protein MNB_SV-5-1415 [hydrothermal vent metagenome]|uniref:Uncharacterized protein n=1 Tax=hydrothermal vent metagenome TaxID=652676 RepID=A0A1W1EFC3_9ZZZZ